MKRKTPLVLSLIIVILCGIATVAYNIVFIKSKDRTPPIISVSPEYMDLSVTADSTSYLLGVTARDNKDGDVTSSIVIEKIGKLTQEHTAVVTFVAFDQAGNLSRATRTLHFTDYEPAVFHLSKALIYPASSSPNVLDRVTAHDQVDGDISDKIKGALLSPVANLNSVGIHEVEFRVTNSLGDTSYITLPVEIYDATEFNASVELTDYLVYVEKNASFKPESYLKNLIVGTNSYSLTNQNPPVSNLSADEIHELGSDREIEVRTYINRYVNPEDNNDPCVDIVNVRMKSEVRTGTPGIYSVIYTVDYEGRYTGYTRLLVIVEE